MPDDTAEYMLGDVYVTVVLMESSTETSVYNNNSETWSSSAIAAVKQRVRDGLQWWEDTLANFSDKHQLDFQIDFTHADAPVVTSYEPITRSSGDLQYWIYDFLNRVGYNTRGNFHSDIRAFNNAQRAAHDTDWAFTIFVVNDENDPDDQFAPGGFSRAFAYAGGELLVSPASRPASTYAHETGHQFWALDEYRPDGDFDRSRGYYNIQNLNSWDNPTPGFVMQPSIMANGQLLDTAYANHTSAVSTLEMIGWRDSDGDGIFDVVDVPLTLSGSGRYDASTGEYRFTGRSAVQTTPNLNPSGLRNDITILKVSRAQYRIDGGTWQTAATYGTAQADLDLRIPLAASASQIEIRTLDDGTGVTSSVFVGAPNRPAAVLLPGINGIVWQDKDRDGAVDADEPGMAGVTVELIDPSGQPLALRQTVEPDQHASETRLNTLNPRVTLSAFGSGVADGTVAALTSSPASTGTNVFASFISSSGARYSADWTPDSRQLRMDFAEPVSTISLDAIGAANSGYARLEVYGQNNQLLARYTTQQLNSGQVETMTLNRDRADIKYAIARGHASTVVRFDNLRFGPQSTATTDANGTYALPYLGPGTFNVRVTLGAGQSATNPTAGSQAVVLGDGEFKGGVDFGVAINASPWQNQNNRFDVNADGSVAPLDALLIINNLNRSGTRPLTSADPVPPYLDVNGDFQLAPLDALQVINQLNRGTTGGEGESHPAVNSGSAAVGNQSGEGEATGQPQGLDTYWDLAAAEVLRSESPRQSLPLASRAVPRSQQPHQDETAKEATHTAFATRSHLDTRPIASLCPSHPRGESLPELESILDELALDVTIGWRDRD